MTQVVEKVAFGGPEPHWLCPFEHGEPEEFPDHENELCGDGQVLAGRMSKGQSTDCGRFKDEPNKFKIAIDPRIDKDSKLFNEGGTKMPLRLTLKSEVKDYPLTAAAHHLIPAQESLKRSSILDWLIGISGQSEVKTGKKTKKRNGKVLKNVGYNVNGAENGVWLPGPYAVKGKWSQLAEKEASVTVEKRRDLFLSLDLRGGKSNDEVVDDWSDYTTVEPDFECEDCPDKVELEIKTTAQLGYAIEAMQLASAQFHDRHADYSAFVVKVLGRLATKLDRSEKIVFCPECKKDRDKNKPPHPPYVLIDRLNQVSERLKGYLVGGCPDKWSPEIYTSKRVLKYREFLEQGQK